MRELLSISFASSLDQPKILDLALAEALCSKTVRVGDTLPPWRFLPKLASGNPEAAEICANFLAVGLRCVGRSWPMKSTKATPGKVREAVENSNHR